MSRIFYPRLEQRLSIEIEDFARLDGPCVIYEGEHRDSDGAIAYVYTVGGMLDGAPVGGAYGVLVGGDAIIVHAETRGAADAMASDGLLATIEALAQERRLGRAGKGGVLASVDAIGKGAMH
ncbi:MAG: hypothetical protein IT531_00180 [Burkholderiales bacterium]|nr:hypothetical protein [Burkholderiales bacterium]